MVKRVETSAILTLTAIENDTFKAGAVTLDMAADGVDYAKTNTELSASVMAQVDAAKADINAGKINVIPTYAEALKAGVVPANLGAKDD